MKKGTIFFLVICVAFASVVAGVYIGRNYTGTTTTVHDLQVPISTAAPTTATVPEAFSTDFRIDLNTATKAELMQLPGIGPTLADRILQYRETNGPFQSITDLYKVNGIGGVRYREIQNYIYVGGTQ